MLEQIMLAWEPYKTITDPPLEAAKLHEVPGVTIYIESGWGPAVPYPSIEHGNGHINHGFRRLKGNPDEISLVPEVIGWPEYERFLRQINDGESPIESVGCEKGFFPNEHPEVKSNLGSYTDIMFSQLALNNEPANHLSLAAKLAESLEGCNAWWSSIELALQRLRALPECTNPWGLMIRVSGYGRDKEQARKTWAASIEKLGVAIAQLDKAFPNQQFS